MQKIMISQVEVPMYLEIAIPEIPHDLIVNNRGSVYNVINMLVVFTSQNIKEHNYDVVKRCFRIADTLYSKGNNMVKSAVENIFVYSFTSMLQANPVEKRKVLGIIPITLYSLYIGQIMHSSC